MSETVWKPEVGKTAWLKFDGKIHNVRIKSIRESPLGGFVCEPEENLSSMYCGFDISNFFPTAEAALASITVYDLEGNEVVVSRAQDKIIDEMCARAADSIFYLKDWDDADYAELGIAPIINGLEEIIAVRTKASLKKMAEIVWNMDVPLNPEGEARLKKAQERFAKLGENPTDERVESDC